MSHFFAYLSRMKYILRWNLMRNTRSENIQEHSLQVAMLAHGLAVIRNRVFGGDVDCDRVMTLAVYHEASEVITGDLATPIKYFNPKIRDAYKQIEGVAAERQEAMLPKELQACYHDLLQQPQGAEHDLVKAADRLSAYLKCVEELKAGNGEFERAMQSIRRDLGEMAERLPEVGYFLEHFEPSFHLTLDELN